MNTNITNTGYDVSHPTYLRWSAIFAGALVALGLGFLLQLFGVAIGLSAYHSSDTGASTVAVGGVLALIVGVIVTMGLAGFVSGFHGRFCQYHPGESFLYGFLTWSVALLLTALLLLPLTQYVSNYNDTLKPRVTVSDNMPQSIKVTQGPTHASNTPYAQDTQTDVKVTSNTLKGSAWLLFLLFFIGAVSSCIGASLGMDCRRKHHVNPQQPVVRQPRL